jgi:hypothetical protein
MATQGSKFELLGKRHFSVAVFVSLALRVMLMATGRSSDI